MHQGANLTIEDLIDEAAKDFPGAGERVSGLRIPVEPRCEPPEERKPIDPGLARSSLVFALFDEHMANDANLLSWLKDVDQADYATLLPVRFKDQRGEFDETPILRDLAPVELSTERERAREQLRRAMLLYSLDSLHAESGGERRIFVSFSRTDGEPIAKKLAKTMFDSYAPWKAFVDKQELGAGQRLNEVLPDAVKTSAALIAVFSAEFPRRPWCAKELRWAREPRLVPDTDNAWCITPLIVLYILGTADWSVSLPEFSGCRITGWEEKRCFDIIDQVLAEAVASSYYANWSRDFPEHLVINWAPDTYTILGVLEKAKLPKKESDRIIVYPGFGLSDSDKKRLERAHRISLATFQQIEQRTPTT